MKGLKILYHSFIDVITNSSTEIYVSATDKSIEALKNIIDNLLSFSGSDKKADDLFTFDLEEHDCWDDYNTGPKYMIVRPKDRNMYIENTAKLLSTLKETFNALEIYN